MDQAQAQFNALLMALRHALVDQPVAVFIDPTLADPLAFDAELKAHYEHGSEQGKVQRLKLPFIHNNFDPDMHPYVLYAQSDERAERLITATLHTALQESLELRDEHKTARTVCGWITDPGNDAQALVNRLATAAKIIKPDGLAWYLRYWDPRVMWQLPYLLPHDHWCVLLSHLQSWHYLTPNQRVTTITTDVMLSSSRRNDQQGFRPTGGALPALTHETWERLVSAGLINKVFAALAEWQPVANEPWLKKVRALFAQCAELGFVHDDDKVVFATTACVTHERFYHHPEVQRVLGNANRSGIDTLAGALGQFDDNFWASVQRGDWLESLQGNK